MWRAAEVLRDATSPTERVFVFGREAIIPYLAQRLPATPYVLAWMLNYEPALRPPASPRHPAPNADERRAIEHLQKEVANDFCARLQREPPAAMVFMDGEPEVGPDGVATLAGLCSLVQTMLASDYHLADNASSIRIYVRNRPAGAGMYIQNHPRNGG